MVVHHYRRLQAFILYFITAAIFLYSPSHAALKKYEFNVQMKNVRRLCHVKPIVTVNGKFPGPTIYAREGDQVVIDVINHVSYNISIHWHGLKQFRNGWVDGAAYITQCPIKMGNNYTYTFSTTDQRGTLWWHAHILSLRATVYGAIIIMPNEEKPFPFPQPYQESNILLGEWWNQDIEAIFDQANQLGVPPQPSDANTINGRVGPFSPCPEKIPFAIKVKYGKTYLLRVINAALEGQFFFAIADHNMTVVEIDGVYTKPFTTSAIMISPGQTTNVLVQAKRSPNRYLMAARAFEDVPVPIDDKMATSIFQYKGVPTTVTPVLPQLPAINDTKFVLDFYSKLKSLNTAQFPAKVPIKIDRRLFFTVGFGLNACPKCQNGTRVVSSLNNITFLMPAVGLLQANYFNIPGVFTTDFPDNPPSSFNYTGVPQSANVATTTGTRLSKLNFNSTVELVIQDTNLLTFELHPFHLHGFKFFVVGSGIGNFDPEKDPSSYNLLDPPERNTVGVPTGGWTAIRFRADNPGVWFFHCHLEFHMIWGLNTAFLVENGKSAEESILPPPKDLPTC